MPKAEDYSVTTGWAINWQQNGGFEAKLKNDVQDDDDFKKNLDSTDGLAAAVCHFYNSNNIIEGSK